MIIISILGRPTLLALILVLWASLASIDGQQRKSSDGISDDIDTKIGDDFGISNNSRSDQRDVLDKDLIEDQDVDVEDQENESSSIDSGAENCIDFDVPTGCYTYDYHNRTKNFGSKTTYDYARGRFGKRYGHNVTINPECQPIALYLIARHAIRYPGVGSLSEFEKHASELQRRLLAAAKSPIAALRNGTMCPEDYLLFSKWRYVWTESDADLVTKSGFKQTMDIGKRYKDRYPQILDPTTASIQVFITDKVRTNTTATAFLRGIGDLSYHERQVSPNLYNHRLCEKLLLDQGFKPTTPKILADYRYGKLWDRLLADMRNRTAVEDLSFKDVHEIMEELCKFETAIYGDGKSPWCIYLTNAHMKVVEYDSDLKLDLLEGYGVKLNRKLGEANVRDMYLRLKDSRMEHDEFLHKAKGKKTKNATKNSSSAVGSRQGGNKLKTYLNFAHAETLTRLYAAMSLFHDEEDMKGDFCAAGDRRWRSSLITPFGGNFAAILYKCPHHHHNHHDTYRFKILTMIQETPITLPGCDSPLCDFEDFEYHYGDVAKSYNLKHLCRL